MIEIEAKGRVQAGRLTLEIGAQFQARVIALEGPTGAGKSTFLRFLAGLLRADHATLKFRDEVWQARDRFVESWHRSVAWVPQDSLLMPHLRVQDNLLHANGSQGDDAVRVAKELGIDHLLRRWPRNLSGGERQRVALGRALIARRKLLLLDEPFSALDVTTRERALAVTKEWASDSTVVFVSHYAREADHWVEARCHITDGVLRLG